MWTFGPSFPSGSPDPMPKVSASAFTTRTRIERNLPMDFPNSMAFTSGKPLPSASGVVRTRTRANMARQTSNTMTPPSAAFPLSKLVNLDLAVPNVNVAWSIVQDTKLERIAVAIRINQKCQAERRVPCWKREVTPFLARFANIRSCRLCFGNKVTPTAVPTPTPLLSSPFMPATASFRS